MPAMQKRQRGMLLVAVALLVFAFTCMPDSHIDRCTDTTDIKHICVQTGPVPLGLKVGWNLVSIPLIATNTSIEYALSPIAGSYDRVDYYDPTDMLDHWKSYFPGKPNMENDLHVINNTMGFWLHMVKNASLAFTGTVPTHTVIPLYTGWNLIGYPSIRNATVSDLFVTLPETIHHEVQRFDSLSPYYLRKMGTTSEVFHTGLGYWVSVSENCTLTVPWS